MKNRIAPDAANSRLRQALIALIVLSVLLGGYLFTYRTALFVKAKPDKRWKKDTNAADPSDYRHQAYKALTGQLARELGNEGIRYSTVRLSPDRIMLIHTSNDAINDISHREKLCLLAKKYYLNGVRLQDLDGKRVDCISCNLH